MTTTLPSGITINLTNITHTRPARWLHWPSSTEAKTEKAGLDVHFIGGSVVRLEQPDADHLTLALLSI